MYKNIPYDQQRARTGDGARSVSLRVPWRALATASTHSRVCESCGLIPCVYRRAAGRATEGLTAWVLLS
ncbi:hypothetical protein PUN28_017627 [Cardiocondyla obscurior]|uniref:Uncharacterized protein n=1 Tax=Cardiocondyla obscurior TaxID=286306 RepID=A0AAW2EIE1_9HYME